MPSEELLSAVAVTAELCGRTFSPAAAAVFVADLAQYPEQQVLSALRRCRREVKGILTVQDVVSRLDDGRPGAEEAWAAIPKDEAGSIVWSEEMAEAFGIAAPLLYDGDSVAARMAFKEAYLRLVSGARDRGIPVRWSPSLGHDAAGREAAMKDAVRLGRITLEHAEAVAPSLQAPNPKILAIVGACSGDAKKMPEEIRSSILALKNSLRAQS